jgi:LPS sulfotransferase NodH
VITKFVILSTARSGTSYLSSALVNHPDIWMHGEIFHPEITKHILAETLKKDIDFSLREEKPIEFLEKIYKYNEDRLVVGFKIWKSQSPKAVSYIIKTPDIKKIILERRNLLASFSSKKIAQQTSVWNINQKKSQTINYETPKIKFNQEEFIGYVNHHQKTYQYYKDTIKSLEQEYLLIDYQKNILTGDISCILDFLNLDKKIELQGQSIKLNKQTFILDRFLQDDLSMIIESLENINKLEWLYEKPE